jgi:3'-phosphoadenosine 5'-phosphosulfate sulfotransferase (PAPS reductase)/FAD synthetase
MIICWWSGGVTSAVACKIALDIYGLDKCRFIMIDTGNEHEDTYRFKVDCEKWYGKKIELISSIGDKYESIQDVWYKHKSLNVAHGAICSYKLKRVVREQFQKTCEYEAQVFGFEFDKKEMNRALSLKANHPGSRPIFPLLMLGYDKEKCVQSLEHAGLEIPLMYKLGFQNNNCFGTGCVQGGIGYWQKIKQEFPEKFEAMAKIEHDLTDLKGQPVTMLKDQSADFKGLVFLVKHPLYPSIKSLADMKKQEVRPLFECNGFCGTNDLTLNKTEKELNLELDFFEALT